MNIDNWLVRQVRSLCEGAMTGVSVDSELSEELEVEMGMHQGSVLSPFLFAVVVDVLTKFTREGILSELLYADDFVLMSETLKGLRNRFLKWKEDCESKDLKVSLVRTKVMVSGAYTQDGMSKSKVDLCWSCSLSVKANTVLSVQCVNWIHGRCARVKMVTPKC